MRSQQRVDRDGKPFRMVEFRLMRRNSEAALPGPYSLPLVICALGRFYADTGSIKSSSFPTSYAAT